MGSHTYTYLPLPSVWRCHLFSFTAPSSLPFFRVTTSLFSACLHSSPLLKSLFLVHSQHICCFSPGSTWTLRLFLSLFCPCLPWLCLCLSVCLVLFDMRLRGSSLVGRSLITDNIVNIPFVCPYLLTTFIYTSVVNTCCILPLRHRVQHQIPQYISPISTGTTLVQGWMAPKPNCHSQVSNNDFFLTDWRSLILKN